jgi:hypothetical protein
MITPLKPLTLVCAMLLAQAAGALEPSTPYPGLTSGGTKFLNKKALLGTVNDPEWFANNIPFLDVPDRQIQQIYYYRWVTYKEHLVYTGPVYGWLSTEFLHPVAYGAPYGGVNAAAGHHISEGRWLRNQQYVKDVINYWLNGPGQFPKVRDESVNADTDDWAHEYSFWAGSAVWQALLAHGDSDFATNLLPSLVKQYRGWDGHYNSDLGLYWQKPVWDATEYTPASYDSPDAYHGGAGYRPTINAYQYGDAKAIAGIASIASDANLASEYNDRANSLQASINRYLWDSDKKFYMHMHRDSNPELKLLDSRELHGYVPWMFNVPLVKHSVAMRQLLDLQGFKANFGPTTAERRAKTFMQDKAETECCRWNGPSWPYQTSQVLTGLANLLIDYPGQSSISANDYVKLLQTYAATQFKDGVPYIAEAHHPDQDRWLYNSHDHSEDYNHSTYVDNVISGLVGLRGQTDNSLVIKPLAPATWDYFALENTPYHGHSVTVLWDRTGSRYGAGSGLSVFVDGRKVAHQAGLDAVRVDVGDSVTQRNVGGLVNVAANPHKFPYAAQPVASYTSNGDDAWQGIDGIVYRTGIPERSRWTSYSSSNGSDFYGVNFQRRVTVKEVRLTFYDDADRVLVPAGYDLQYWDGGSWVNVPGQKRAFDSPAGNAMNRVTFPQIATSQLRVVAPNRAGVGWGLSEFEAYSKPIFKIVNVSNNKTLAVDRDSLADGVQVQQFSDNDTSDHLWELIDAGNGYYQIRNMKSNRLLGVKHMSTADGVLIKQVNDNGTGDQLWQFIDTVDKDRNPLGQFKIRSRHSGLLLGADSASALPFYDTGSPDHLWQMQSADDPR